MTRAILIIGMFFFGLMGVVALVFATTIFIQIAGCLCFLIAICCMVAGKVIEQLGDIKKILSRLPNGSPSDLMENTKV